MTTSSSSASSSRLVIGLVVGLVFAGLLFAALSGGGDDAASTDAAFGSPRVSGPALLPLPQGATPDQDPARGSTAPIATGPGPDGADVTVGEGPQLIAFLAHWCPHCRAEVPVVVSWVAAGGLPDGVSLAAVATSTDPGQPNFPPTSWLEREAWPAPVLLDDADDTAGQAFGVSGFPFWVAVDADGTVVARVSGELTTTQLDALVGAIAP